MNLEDVKDRVVGLEYHKAEEIQVNPNNYREHDEAQRESLESVLTEVGIAGALTAYRSERAGGELVLIDGELRKGTGLTWPVLVLDVTDEEADLLLATMDPIRQMAATRKTSLRRLLDAVIAKRPETIVTLDRIEAMVAARAETIKGAAEKSAKNLAGESPDPDSTVSSGTGLPDDVYGYRIVFDTLEQQQEFHAFVRRLKVLFSEEGTIGGRMIAFLHQTGDVWRA